MGKILTIVCAMVLITGFAVKAHKAATPKVVTYVPQYVPQYVPADYVAPADPFADVPEEWWTADIGYGPCRCGCQQGGPCTCANCPQWYTDYDAAIAEAKRTGKSLIVLVTTDHCPYCVTLESKLKQLDTSKFVKCRTQLSGPLANVFGATAAPTLVISDKAMNITQNLRGDQSLDYLRAILAPVAPTYYYAPQPVQPRFFSVRGGGGC